MKRIHLKNILEKAQVIPLVVVMFVVIIGMVALIVDGGAIMSNRRTAQAAADAGALAGAQRACLGYNDAKTVAENYATGKNDATSALATVVGMQVTVNATVQYASFFAGIFGDPTLEAVAEAKAGCFGVKGKAVVPIAWNCRARSVGGGPFNPAYGCQIQTLSWQSIGPLLDPTWNPPATSVSISDYDGNVVTYRKSGTYTNSIVNSAGVPPEQIYIVVDSDKICIEDNPLTGAVRCDLDGDGKNDIQTGGDRGWLYLTADTNSVGKWITDYGAQPDFSMNSHKWLSGQSGAVTSLYNSMISAGYQGQVIMVPVYNVLCAGDPRTNSTCVNDAHAYPWPAFNGSDDFSEIRNNQLNYHIISFAPFYVSCIDTKGNCPGYRHAQTLPYGSELKNVPVVEGFFLTDYDVSPDSTQDCSINLGNCSISLSK